MLRAFFLEILQYGFELQSSAPPASNPTPIGSNRQHSSTRRAHTHTHRRQASMILQVATSPHPAFLFFSCTSLPCHLLLHCRVVPTRRLRNRRRRRRGPCHIPRTRLRHRRFRRPARDEARARRRDLARTAEAQRDVDSGLRLRKVDLALHGEFFGAGDVVEGVGRRGVVVCIVSAKRRISHGIRTSEGKGGRTR
jgi:hypothetical protein